MFRERHMPTPQSGRTHSGLDATLGACAQYFKQHGSDSSIGNGSSAASEYFKQAQQQQQGIEQQRQDAWLEPVISGIQSKVWDTTKDLFAEAVHELCDLSSGVPPGGAAYDSHTAINLNSPDMIVRHDTTSDSLRLNETARAWHATKEAVDGHRQLLHTYSNHVEILKAEFAAVTHQIEMSSQRQFQLKSGVAATKKRIETQRMRRQVAPILNEYRGQAKRKTDVNKFHSIVAGMAEQYNNELDYWEQARTERNQRLVDILESMAVITRLKANGGSREEIAAAASEARNKMKLEEQRRSAEDLRLPEVPTSELVVHNAVPAVPETMVTLEEDPVEAHIPSSEHASKVAEHTCLSRALLDCGLKWRPGNHSQSLLEDVSRARASRDDAAERGITSWLATGQ